MNNAKILVIDDEVQIRKLLQITLASENYDVIEAGTGKAGMVNAAIHPPDLILLDLGLPDEDGHIILKLLREWYIGPIIILSVRNNDEDIVKALDNGATDYLSKPFRTGELLARIRSALRNSEKKESTIIYVLGNLVIDLNCRTVKVNNELVKLTSTEYSLLVLLVKNEGKVLTHQYILKNIWGPSYIEQTQYLRVYIAQLRKKIEKDPLHPELIITESGVGYRFAEFE